MNRILMSFLIVILICFNVQAENLILGSGQDAEITELKSALIPCTNNSLCDWLINAECINGVCQCNGSNFCKEKSTESIVVTKIGQTCKIDDDCNIEHSVCTANRCACKEGRVASFNERKCLQVADGLGSTCEENIQCYKKVIFSDCQNEKCGCQQQMHEYNGACYRNVALGEQCHLQGECSATTFARCTNEICRCQNGYVQSNAANKCLEIPTKEAGPCEEDIQCSKKFGKAHCEQGHCQCAELYQFKAKKEMCVRDMRLGDNCQNHTDCHGPETGESRSECILGVCKCRSEFIEESGFCTSGSIPAVYVSPFLLFLGLLFITYFKNTFVVHLML